MPRAKRTRKNRKGPLRRLIFVLLLVFALTAGYAAIDIFLLLPATAVISTKNPRTTALMRLRRIQAEKKGEPFFLLFSWTSFSGIPDLMKKSIRITEDASFYSHKGIDMRELKEAVKKDLKEMRFARGGSTITQQLAKNLYLSTGKTFWRKIKEYAIARRLEKNLSKDRIFELYLNVIEFGKGVFGVRAASRYYFDRELSELTTEQIVRLTAVIPRPLRSDPRGSDRWLLWKCRWITGKLRLYGYIGEADYAALSERFETPD
jgi:monofunctional glycosyltransferase